MLKILADVSDIFSFFLLGGGEGGVRGARKGQGSVFFIENPRGGGILNNERGGGAVRGREGVRREFSGGS